ncbi:FabD/lysophospholipase-like protein [Lentithecium fluviatile CBS 122367]|uniref:FabD/lysophospholipase-like protein n=1 Tax=Lentithecium fluviatile CBS 122367 TaxID=1168545 RepID=A0A6G1IMJ3_9PLEO|nr:FabD/lysophospholipase-like protein [Lentithecium fluviatile CBS 122367]
MVSPPPQYLYQSSLQVGQITDLQQGFQDLSVTPGLSSTPSLSPSFKEVTRPISTPTPPRKTPKNESGPSVLRVQTEGHASALRKILCLDGGGVRGLASLMILKHLMDRLESQRGGRLEPWQEFDMIAGTSTGGLIAIMLGRLRMTVDECIETYKTLSRRIFSPVHSKANIAGRALTKLKAEGKFESEPLEQVVKEICRDRGLSEAELLKDNSDDAPKVFVCAAQGINSDAVVIRSYKSGDGEYDDLYQICKIWEAARATSAASTFFPPIQIGYQKYVDGALRYNNPIEKADQESRALWPKEERLIVSVGTGSAPGPNVLASNIADLAKTLAKIVTDTEDENKRFMKRNKEMAENNLLFRFNVLQGLADVELSEWEAIGEIMAHTGTYMRSPDTTRFFDKCAEMMKQSGQRLGYIAGEGR